MFVADGPCLQSLAEFDKICVIDAESLLSNT